MKNSFFFFMIFISLLITACSSDTPKADIKQPISNLDIYKVKTMPITNGLASQSIKATGILGSDLESKPAFKTGGVIEKTFFKEGDRINKGALLATLNLSEIKAQVDQAKKVVEKTTRDLARVKNLFADSVATLEQMQNAQTAYDLSLETVKIAEFNQSYSKVIAPTSGIIMKQIMREGEIVGPGIPICVIMGVGQNHWILKAAVADKDWAQIKKGDKAMVSFEAFPGQSFEGIVDKMADMANVGTATLDVEIKLNQVQQKLAAGLIANIEIKPGKNPSAKSKISIPIEALVSSHDGEAVVFVPQNGKASKKIVRIDKIVGTQVQLISGLEGLSEIITSGAVYLEDGNQIEIIK